MKQAFLRASLIISLLLAPSAFASADMKGGIVYWLHTGYSCPGFYLTNTLPNHFEINQRTGVICPFGVIGNQRALYTFVLGPLPPATYWMKESSDFGAFNDLQFTIPVTTDQLLTNLTLNASGQLTFHINGYGTVRYVVQKTSDFQTWTEADIIVGEGDFTDTAPASIDPVFFRIKLVEPPPTIIP